MNNFRQHFLKSLVLGCIIFMVLVVLRIASGGSFTWDLKMLFGFLFTLLYTVSIYFVNAFVFIALDRVYSHDRFNKKRLLIGFLASFAATLVVIFLLRILEEVIINKKRFGQFLNDENISSYSFSVIIFFFISLIVHAFYFYKAYQENKVREQQIIAGTASAKFESLKNQIDPHFLFNSLNVLSSLIEENPESAQKFTTSLSKVYRYVLEQKDKELVSVAEELAFAKTYMNLLKMRFENSLFFELPEAVPQSDAFVVPLSLQLLLENTVKHNVASEQKPLQIRIYLDDNYLVIENDFMKKEVIQDRPGVGLQNIISRYALITRRKVSVLQRDNIFEVRIPVLTKQIETMETYTNSEEANYYKMQRKVEDIKGFYSNLYSYILINIGLAVLNLATYPQFLWFLFPVIGWGIGVIVHWMSVFNYIPFLGRDWEERKIREIIERDKARRWN
ncbi:MAG TPA: histidine kinase [Flavobacterium sp.]|jgi:hypothetical protein